MASMYYKNAHAIVLAFGLDSITSFENLSKWMKDIE